MNVTSTILPKSQAELTIEISVEETQPYIDAAAAQISKQVEIKGFRKGKVPYEVLAKEVGEQAIYEEAFNAIVEATYSDAVDQEKLQVVGRANIDIEKLAPGNPVVYKAIVPLMPEVKLGDYKKLKSKKEKAEFDEKKYEKTLKDLRTMRAKEKLVDREAKDGDKTVIDFDLQVNGVSIEGGKGEKQPLTLGEGQFIPGFEENIIGMKKGEEKKFDVTFPKEYHKKDLQGVKASATVTLQDVYEIELPELNDEMAQEMNFKTVELLEQEIRKNIEKELKQEIQEKFESALIEELVKKSEFDELPDQLIDEETQKMLGELKQNITPQGLKFEDYLQHLDKTEEGLKEGFVDQAQMRIKAALVMREVAIAEDIKIDAKKVDEELEQMKKVYAQMPEMVQEIESPAHRARMENALMHKATFEVLEAATK